MDLSSNDISILKSIENTEISSIVFIRDYIQLIFEGPVETATLTAFTLPIVTNNGTSFTIQMSGYRDALCSLISKRVLKTITQEKVAIRLFFEGNEVVEISLRDEDYEGPEAVMFREGETLIVW
jgi:hypothetical protein